MKIKFSQKFMLSTLLFCVSSCTKKRSEDNSKTKDIVSFKQDGTGNLLWSKIEFDMDKLKAEGFGGASQDPANYNASLLIHNLKVGGSDSISVCYYKKELANRDETTLTLESLRKDSVPLFPNALTLKQVMESLSKAPGSQLKKDIFKIWSGFTVKGLGSAAFTAAGCGVAGPLGLLIGVVVAPPIAFTTMGVCAFAGAMAGAMVGGAEAGEAVISKNNEQKQKTEATVLQEIILPTSLKEIDSIEYEALISRLENGFKSLKDKVSSQRTCE